MREFYERETSAVANPLPLENLFALSKMITEKISEYRHSDFQAAIAGVVLSHICDFKIVISPTGSGKTWIQGIVAKYYCSLGKKVVVVEPNESLCAQSC